ncbi:MAG: hypothetical protein ACK5CA_15285 [Cyanobacteriota bacterium]
MNKYIYLEFLTPIKDYITTLKKREFVFEWFVPFIMALLIYVFFLEKGSYKESIKQLNGYIITFLGILIGFSMTSVTLLVTSNSKNIERLQGTQTERRVETQLINLYQLVLINFVFVLMMEIFTLLINLIFSLVDTVSNKPKEIWMYFYTVNVFLLLNIVLLSIRNTTNIYFVFLANKKN